MPYHAGQRHVRAGDCVHGPDHIALDAGNFHQPGHGVTHKALQVGQRHGKGFGALFGGAAAQLHQGGGCHGAGSADLGLAAALCPGNAGLLGQHQANAARRGQRRGLSWGVTKEEREQYRELLGGLGLGLESRLATKVSTLSGGQRQALTLLMATLKRPKLLLLDEHTAALDPKTAAKGMELTDRIVREGQLTTMMITHNMRDAIQYGNRLIMLHEGHIILDIAGEEKKNLTVPDLLEQFTKASGDEFANDRAILS